MVHHKKENTPKTLINIAFGNLFRGSEEDKVLRKHPGMFLAKGRSAGQADSLRKRIKIY